MVTIKKISVFAAAIALVGSLSNSTMSFAADRTPGFQGVSAQAGDQNRALSVDLVKSEMNSEIQVREKLNLQQSLKINEMLGRGNLSGEEKAQVQQIRVEMENRFHEINRISKERDLIQGLDVEKDGTKRAEMAKDLRAHMGELKDEISKLAREPQKTAAEFERVKRRSLELSRELDLLEAGHRVLGKSDDKSLLAVSEAYESLMIRIMTPVGLVDQVSGTNLVERAVHARNEGGRSVASKVGAAVQDGWNKTIDFGADMIIKADRLMNGSSSSGSSSSSAR